MTIRPAEDRVLKVRASDGAKLVRALDTRIMIEDASGLIRNDPDTGIPMTFGSLSQAVAWLDA